MCQFIHRAVGSSSPLLPLSHSPTLGIRRGHSLIELVAATVASVVLLAGLGSVMLIARQVAYTPMGATRRTDAANVISQLSDELQHATLLVGQAPNVLEFVVADRNDDGTDEKLRYEWSGTSGAPLRKIVNGGAPVIVLESVNNFNATYLIESKTQTLTTTTEAAESKLLDLSSSGSDNRPILDNRSFAQLFTVPNATGTAAPAGALGWKATRVRFRASKGSGGSTETLLVQLRAAGSFSTGPTSHVLAEVQLPEPSLPGGIDWKEAVFANPVARLALNREYAITWSQLEDSGEAARLAVDFNLPAPLGLFESIDDDGASWPYWQEAGQYAHISAELYGHYIVPGSSYNVTRNYVSHVNVVLQAGAHTHARVDASVPLFNRPEVLSAYWRTDFDRDPTTTNVNGDAEPDWTMAGGAPFDANSLDDGVWTASGALETRPFNDFLQTTIVEMRLRNSSVGGNGAVVRINADRQLEAGQLKYAPLLVYLRRQNDGTQTLTLNGKTSDAATKPLFTCSRLPGDFVRVRLLISPQNNVVNLAINDVDQGSFIYPTYPPSTNTDRFVTLFGHTSQAEFDYVDVRVAN